jgi:hypothetical protein
MDNAMLGGCVVFSLASVAQLVCVFIAFATADELLTKADLSSVTTTAVVPMAVIGVAFAFLSGTSGYFGSVSGLIPAALFTYLRIRHAVIGMPGIEGMRPAEFPAGAAWTTPLLISATCVVAWTGSAFLRSRGRVERKE